MRLSHSLFALVAILAPLPQAAALQPSVQVALGTPQARLRAAFSRFATMTDGTVGIAIQRVGGGDPVTLNGDTLFPMASTFKIAIAGAVLAKVDAGTLSLDTMIDIKPKDIVSSDGVGEFAVHPGVALSIHNLLELMLTRSDNTAADILLGQAGGAAAVTRWLRAVGISEQRVDGGVAQMLYRAMGIAPTSGSYRQNVDAALKADPALRDREWRDQPNLAFAADPRDTSTPAAMAQLLDRIALGKALKPATTAELLAIMARCHTGANRLQALLPPNTAIAHKTGTVNGLGNDVGIVTMPGGGAFVIAVFVMKDSKGHAARDRIMAEAARTAYDYYLFTGV